MMYIANEIMELIKEVTSKSMKISVVLPKTWFINNYFPMQSSPGLLFAHMHFMKY